MILASDTRAASSVGSATLSSAKGIDGIGMTTRGTPEGEATEIVKRSGGRPTPPYAGCQGTHRSIASRVGQAPPAFRGRACARAPRSLTMMTLHTAAAWGRKVGGFGAQKGQLGLPQGAHASLTGKSVGGIRHTTVSPVTWCRPPSAALWLELSITGDVRLQPSLRPQRAEDGPRF